MLDLATLGPLRRVIKAARQPKIKGDKGKAKMLVSEVEGIVNQVSRHSRSLTRTLQELYYSSS